MHKGETYNGKCNIGSQFLMHKAVIRWIVLLQLIVIFVILNRILTTFKKNNVLGTTILSPLNKDDLVFPDDPEFKYFYSLEPSIETIENRPWDDSEFRINHNDDGLNERYNYNILKTEGTFRIITLGDSFTYGVYVDTNNNWTELLEDLLNQENACTKINKFEVINLGVAGYDVPYTVKHYSDSGLKYHPDMVIWLESGTGFTKYNELLFPLVDACKEDVASGKYQTKSKDKYFACWEDMEAQMIEDDALGMTDILNEWMSKFMTLISTTPTIFAVMPYLDNDITQGLQIKAASQPNAFYMNEIEDIRSSGSFPDRHPNEKGHSVIARSIYDYLIKNKTELIQCD